MVVFDGDADGIEEDEDDHEPIEPLLFHCRADEEPVGKGKKINELPIIPVIQESSAIEYSYVHHSYVIGTKLSKLQFSVEASGIPGCLRGI